MNDKLVIGEVLKPQGIRGELKVKPLLDDAPLIKNFRTVFIGEQEFKVLSARCGGGFAYLALSGVADRNAAELLRGKLLEGLRADAPEPEEGRYYVVDLIGCTAVTETGECIGEITDILPAHTDVYVLKNGEKESMFPAADGVVLQVDISAKKIVCSAARLAQVIVEQ